MATNSMFMWSQGTSKSYKGMPKGRYYNFKTGDVPAIKDNAFAELCPSRVKIPKYTIVSAPTAENPDIKNLVNCFLSLWFPIKSFIFSKPFTLADNVFWIIEQY